MKIKGVFILIFFSVFVFQSFSANLIVKSIPDLNKKVRNAQPGDTLTLQNGTYTNEKLVFHAVGTTAKPIVIQAETAGKVFIEGNSTLRLGGEFVELHGFVFRNGFAEVAWEFRSKSGMLANNCRITNCIIDGYNNPNDSIKERWVLIYGKNNRIDYCNFINKINEGVLMAVVLEEKKNDEASRLENIENHHSIDHNYFGKRPLLKYVDNGGEIIRIGDSHTSLLSSRTMVKNNVFEECDGEVEIISVKSCDNVLSNNYFLKSAGALVLRHGHRNLVENNVFIGYGKKSTAGVRVINNGHTVRNNYFESLVGKGSFSAFSVMNALENPLPNEYHQVKNVLIEKNTFVECKNISFNLRHTDPDRAAVQVKQPENVTFRNNTFYNAEQPIEFNLLDGESGIHGFKFKKNKINTQAWFPKTKGFKIAKVMKKPIAPAIDFDYGTKY